MEEAGERALQSHDELIRLLNAGIAAAYEHLRELQSDQTDEPHGLAKLASNGLLLCSLVLVVVLVIVGSLIGLTFLIHSLRRR
jgi:hypothetical protein